MRVRRLGHPGEPRFRIVVHDDARNELLALPISQQRRFRDAIDRLGLDPYRARPGCDVRPLERPEAGTLFLRLRVGARRACYAVVTRPSTVFILVVEDREIGYDRMIRIARQRFKGSFA